MATCTALLRLLIEDGDVSTYEAERVVLKIGNALPASPKEVRLAANLHDALDMLMLAEALRGQGHGAGA